MSYAPAWAAHPDVRAAAPVAGALYGDPLLAYVRKRLAELGVDPAAALAVASTEGGFHGAIGDQGTSWGPWQEHEGGALPAGIKDPRAWANSPAGLDHAMRGIAAVAKGEHGDQAIADIVRLFERPAGQYVQGEISKAEGRYGGFAGGMGGGGGGQAADAPPPMPAAAGLPMPGVPQTPQRTMQLPVLPSGGGPQDTYQPSTPDVRGFLSSLIGQVGKPVDVPTLWRSLHPMPMTGPARTPGGQPLAGGGLTEQPAPAPAASSGSSTSPGGVTSPAASPLERNFLLPDGKGKVTLAAGADRAGMKTNDAVLNFVGRVAAVYGKPLTIGTGTNHHEYSRPGHQSDHWTGNAADIPATGPALVQLGQAALIAAGADPAWARQQQGGLYNVNGHQIIFAVDLGPNGGGNHFNHLHVSAH